MGIKYIPLNRLFYLHMVTKLYNSYQKRIILSKLPDYVTKIIHVDFS